VARAKSCFPGIISGTLRSAFSSVSPSVCTTFKRISCIATARSFTSFRLGLTSYTISPAPPYRTNIKVRPLITNSSFPELMSLPSVLVLQSFRLPEDTYIHECCWPIILPEYDVTGDRLHPSSAHD
jgi:hypothetical protein